MSGADLLVSGRIQTLDSGRPTAEALAVTNGLVTAVGTWADLVELRTSRTQVLDVGSAVVLPGFVDGHTHPLLGVETAVGLDLSSCLAPEQVQSALEQEAAAATSSAWVRAWGLDPNAFAGRPLHRELIDDVVGGRPALVLSFDGHAGLASTAALRLAFDGTDSAGWPAGVVRDVTGQPTGALLEEDAIRCLLAAVPVSSFAERCDQLEMVLRQMASVGLTGGHVMDLEDDDLAVYRELDGQGRLVLRLRLAPWCRPEDDAVRRQHLVDLQRERGRVWGVDAVKLFIDGTVDAGTAWLDEADRLGESTTAYWPDPEEYSRVVAFLATAGVQTATHAIGDAAIRHVVDTLQRVPRTTAPHRIEHLEAMSAEIPQRMRAIGLTASMQPTHATEYTRADGTDNWSTRLGPERAARGWRCADLARAGVNVALGSDWPVAPHDPRGIMAAARDRRSLRDPAAEPVGAAQALTAAQALDGYTRAAAVAAGEEGLGGRIAPGFRADLTVLAEDPLLLSPNDLVDVPVVATVMDGVLRYLDDGL
jgi:hypothetical protein